MVHCAWKLTTGAGFNPCFVDSRMIWTGWHRLRRSPWGISSFPRYNCAEAVECHTPVLLEEVLDCFKDTSMKVYVDATLGGAGHAASLIQAHPELETFVGIDTDPTALRIARARLESLESHVKIHLFQDNFRNTPVVLSQHPCLEDLVCGGVDGMLMDIGVSSMQVDDPKRGFSFIHDGPLDMRMDPNAAITAEEVVNTWSEVDLGRILRDYGEEKTWRRIAKRICNAREQKPIHTTQQLVKVVGNTFIISRKKSSPKIHAATRTFQALRIAVNKELVSLEEALPAAIKSLRPGGRLCVISFHSLEDRIVKRAFLKAAGRAPLSDFVYEKRNITFGSYDDFKKYSMPEKDPATAKIITTKPVTPGEVEIEQNPRSRSAKLRVLEKL